MGWKHKPNTLLGVSDSQLEIKRLAIHVFLNFGVSDLGIKNLEVRDLGVIDLGIKELRVCGHKHLHPKGVCFFCLTTLTMHDCHALGDKP